MSQTLQLTYIIGLGALCQYCGWKTSIPSILFLLLAGIAAGPVLGLVQPDPLFGALITPIIEFSIAVILFEGGLSLSQAELGKVGGIVLRLLSVGVGIVWFLISLFAYFVLNLGLEASLLLGAILVVSGPTVVTPILRSIRAKAPIEPILRWEGILIDPIGVLLAVLVAELCHSGINLSAPWHIVSGLAVSLGVGLLGGWIGSLIIKHTVGRHLVPDQLIVPVTLATLFSVVTVSNLLHEQSGLLTSTIMGLLIAFSKAPWVHIVEEFVNHIQKIFVGALFIILAAKLDPDYIRHLDIYFVIFIMGIIFIVRPLAVFISTIRTGLSVKDKAAISMLAPRGIVSAALASSLGTTLAGENMLGMQYIVPYTFFTIIGSVAFYAIFAPLSFKLLGATQSSPEGVLIMGGGRFALELGKIIKKEGFNVSFADSNKANAARIRRAGFPCFHGNILSDETQDHIELDGIGKFLGCTTNDEANSLATIEFGAMFGSANVFQVASIHSDSYKVGGRILCNQKLSLDQIDVLWQEGYRPFCKNIDIPSSGNKTPENTENEYVLAEIEGQKLRLVSQDNLLRFAKPNKQIVFAKVPTP